MENRTHKPCISCALAALGCLVEIEMRSDAHGHSIRLQPRFIDFLVAVDGRFLHFAGGQVIALGTLETLHVIGSSALNEYVEGAISRVHGRKRVSLKGDKTHNKRL